MQANGSAIAFYFEGDAIVCASYMTVARVMLEQLARIDHGAMVRDRREFDGGNVSVKVLRMGMDSIQKAWIEAKTGYPQIASAQTETLWNNTDWISRTVFDLFEVGKQPVGTPPEYGHYAFAKRHFITEQIWTNQYPYGEFLHKNQLWFYFDGGAYLASAPVENSRDPAYPAGYTIGSPENFIRQFSIPYYNGGGYIGQYFYGAIPVNRGFWYNYTAQVTDPWIPSQTESDFLPGGSNTKTVNVLWQTELIDYKAKNGERQVLQNVYGLWVYCTQRHLDIIQPESDFTANDNRVFYCGTYIPMVGATDVPAGGSQIVVSYSDFVDPDHTRDTHNVLVWTGPFDPASNDDAFYPWSVRSASSTNKYLYIVIARYINGDYQIKSKVLVIDAVTLALIQVIEENGIYLLNVQFNDGKTWAVVETAYLKADWGLQYPNDGINKGVIQYRRIYDVSIDKNGIHALTLRHRSLMYNTTSSGSGTEALVNELQSHLIINTNK